MPTTSYLWDTCVLYRLLQGSPTPFVDHIEKHLEDCLNSKCEIYISSISLAEIRPSAINRPGLSPIQVLSSISSNFIVIDTSPNIMSLAGILRDQKYQQSDGPESRAAERPLGLGDAIQLSTAVSLREEFGVQNLTFHSFDEGKRRDSESGGKKTVPMIGFEKWCRACSDNETVQKVISVPKKLPEHPLCQVPRQ